MYAISNLPLDTYYIVCSRRQTEVLLGDDFESITFAVVQFVEITTRRQWQRVSTAAQQYSRQR